MRKLGREQLIQLVTKIINVEGSEEQIDEWVQLVEDNVPHPAVTDLIYYSQEQLTPEQIVDKALAYKPIQL
jgi:hypothetical protein